MLLKEMVLFFSETLHSSIKERFKLASIIVQKQKIWTMVFRVKMSIAYSSYKKLIFLGIEVKNNDFRVKSC